MTDYINRETVLRRVEEMRVKGDDYAPDVAQAIYDFVVDMDAADVAPVVHGTWVDLMIRDWHCSQCGSEIMKKRHIDGYTYDDKPKWCPDCGALMDGKDAKCDTCANKQAKFGAQFWREQCALPEQAAIRCLLHKVSYYVPLEDAAKCETCANSRRVLTEKKGWHNSCKLSRKKSSDCLRGEKSSYVAIDGGEENATD